MSSLWILPVAGAVLGLIIGSFLGAVVMRWPVGRSVSAGRSQCDGCGRTLRASDLIPVLSALLSRGWCRECGAMIDPVHMGMELGCAAIGAAALLLASPLPALGWMLLGWGLLTLAVLDARHYWLPDMLTLPLAFLGLTIGPWVTGTLLFDAVLGAALGYGGLVLVALGYQAVRGREGLGLGDAKLLGALGAWLGWQVLPFILLAASVSALMWVMFHMARGRRIDRTTRIAFGTFLCAAAVPAYAMVKLILLRG